MKTEKELLAASPRKHHSSHLALLRRAASTELGLSPVDAIVVPTARPSKHLRTAMRLAGQFDCHLLALCSKQATVAETL
ncbi:MAG TPA: hypothetical protein VH352_25735, partial [Pseudonocardiaceae bacterium]|nr:hypothetical protein [Pseudonocardiaceae bacterium]